MDRPNNDYLWKWHVAINKFAQTVKHWPSWMYQAKSAADEVPRLAMLFERERTGNLPQVHHQCSHDPQGTPVPDNHLTCVLGTECRNCVFLLAFDGMDATAEQIDQIKAWTCVTHILTELGKERAFDTSEGFITTTDDKMYWQNVFRSLSNASDESESEDDDHVQ